MPHPFRRRPLALLLSALVAVAVVAAPALASTWPATPTHVRVVAVTDSSLTVASARAKNATSYRLWASPVRGDLWNDALKHPRASRRTASSRTPQVTVTGLTYASGPLYYRYAAVNGTHRRYVGPLMTYLRPATPSPVTVQDPFGRPYLSWPASDVTGYQVRQSSDLAATADVTTYTLHGRARSFTPTYDATSGQTYYLSIRAVNGSSRSPYSAAVSATTTVGRTALSVLTANAMNAKLTRYSTTGAPVSPWIPDRRNAALALYRRVDPDILLIQEGGILVSGNTRQVDTIANAMGSSYTVAHTENAPGTGGFVSHGVYVIYRNTSLTAVGTGSTLTLAKGKYAAFQVLRDNATQRMFLVATAHLVAGGTTSADAQRRQEMSDILAEAQRISAAAAPGGIPIIFGGCLHEVRSPHHPADSPYTVLSAAGFADTLTSAQLSSGGDLNSFNNYQRPIRRGLATDRIFVGPGVGVTKWVQLLHRSGNNLVGVIPSDHNPIAATVVLPGS